MVGGSVASGDEPCWNIDVAIDIGYHYVFGYEFMAPHCAPVPISQKAIGLSDFIPSNSTSTDHVYMNTGQTTVVSVKPLRVLVCISLVCCEPDTTFTPGYFLMNPVSAARVFPHAAIFATHPSLLSSYQIDIEMMRPESSGHVSDDMNKEIGASLYADANIDTSVWLSPYWPRIFDWTHTNPNVGDEFVAVYPSSEKPKERSFLDAVVVSDGDGEVLRTVVKVPRQGEFDSIHLAPTMRFNEGHRMHPTWGYDRVVMAPFCVHDCFHVHWRWGLGLDQLRQWNYGWSENKSWDKKGAPMVPPDQKVTIKLLGSQGATAHGIRYRAHGLDFASAGWSIIMSHGAAFSYDDTFAATMLKTLDWSEWPEYYWTLRFSISSLDSSGWVKAVEDFFSGEPSKDSLRPVERIRFKNSADGILVRKG
jgi:hypothetical protein